MRNDKHLDDRLSGYLDGELSSSEAAALERELAADPNLRQLRDDLLTLRGELKSLPTQRPSADFSDRVMAAVSSTQAVEPAVKVTIPARAGKKPLPGWATFAMGMAASAAVMLIALTLFQGNDRPHGVVAVAPRADEKDLARQNKAEGEGDQQFVPNAIGEQVALADDVPQIADVLRKGREQAGVVHVLRLQMGINQLRGGSLDKALLSQKFTVSGALDRPELAPHVALAYRGLPQARLIAGHESDRRPLAEIVYLDLPADRLDETLTALAAAGGSAGKIAPEVRLAKTPMLIEVASAGRHSDAVHGEAGRNSEAKSSDVPSTSENATRPLAIRIGAKQIKKALGESVQEGEFATPSDDEVDVLLFVRILAQ
jgi:negative regulator of sigma E activity